MANAHRAMVLALLITNPALELEQPGDGQQRHQRPTELARGNEEQSERNLSLGLFDGVGEGLDQKSFGSSRHPFQQQVPSGEQ